MGVACALSQEFVHLRLSIKPVSRDQSARSFLLTESRCVVCGAGAVGGRGGCGEATAHQRSGRGSAFAVKLDWGEVHPANEALISLVHCGIAGPDSPLAPTHAPHPSFLLRFWPQT